MTLEVLLSADRSRYRDPEPSIRGRLGNPAEEKEGNRFECIGIGDDFLNTILIAQALRSMINKWDFMKLKRFVRQRKPSFGQSSSLQNRKRFYQLHI